MRAPAVICKQRGVTLIELMLVVGLMSVTTLLSFYDKQLSLEQAKARQVGGYIFQYNNAVRSALAQGVVTSTTVVYGTDWLKNDTCGGVLSVDAEFLPCDFPSATTADPIRFGSLSWSTAINVSGTTPNRKTVATTVTSPFMVSDHLGASKIRADLAGLASLSAAAALTSGFTSSNGFTPFTATTDSSYKSDPLRAIITVVASNTANHDVWLRTDGGNKMNASLAFDGVDPSNRMILGASRIQNFAGQTLHLGSGGGLTSATSSGVVIDNSAEVLGDFTIQKSVVVNKSLTVDKDIYAKGNVISDNDVNAKGNLHANGSVVGQLFLDSNDNSYYVDPSETSNINSLHANNIVSTGTIKAQEYIELGGIAYEGKDCAPNGVIGRNLEGKTLSCQSGHWAQNESDGLSFYKFNMVGVGISYYGLGKVEGALFWGDAWCTTNLYCGTTGYQYCGNSSPCINGSGQYGNNNGKVGLAAMPVYNVLKMPGW